MFGNIKIKTRPLRVAFVVNPNNKDSVRKAIQINSSLWGGSYNPLVPLFKSVPDYWSEPKTRTKPKDIVKGYIEAFDPDVIVSCVGNNIPKYIKEFDLEVIDAGKIWSNKIDDGENDEKLISKLGVGIFELLNPVFDDFFKYKMRFSKKIIIPKIPQENSLFWASIFGEYPKQISKYITREYDKSFDIEEVELKESRIKKLFNKKNLTPRWISRYQLKVLRRGGFRDDYIFYMNINNCIDIIDYWNLRAVGKSVVPVPREIKDDKHILNIVKHFIKSSYKPLKHNKDIYNHVTFLKSRTSDMKEMEEYAKTFDLSSIKKGDKSPFVLQYWYPRMWEEWGRDKDGVDPDTVFCDEKEIELEKDFENFRLEPLAPKFAWKYVGYGIKRFANELETRFYSREKLLAQIYPKNAGKKVLRAISEFSFHEKWRMGKDGLVKIVSDGTADFINAPYAEKIFSAWLEDAGYKVELSSPGRVAKNIHSKLKGFPKIIGNKDVIELFNYINSKSTGISAGELSNRLKNISGKNGQLERFVDYDIFRMGAKIKCRECGKHTFYEINTLKEELYCPKCLNKFSVIKAIGNNCWHYKTAGPFSIENYAEGAYCVLLAVDFFVNNMHGMSVTPIYSFKAKKKQAIELEADFGLFWHESRFSEISEGVIFGECKTFCKFNKKDFDRMSLLAKLFPGSVIVFCTLRDKLEEDEIENIAKIAKKGRKYWGNDKPVNPVLILTGNELFDHMPPPYAWKKIGLEDKYKKIHGLLDICNATQQVYLNLPSWYDDWDVMFRKQNKSKKKIKN